MNELNVGQLIDALSQCDRDLPVYFSDSDVDSVYRILFVVHASSYESGHMVCLHRYVPDLDAVDSDLIISVSDRSPTFARVEYEDPAE